jgi:hypothetical protein
MMCDFNIFKHSRKKWTYCTQHLTEETKFHLSNILSRVRVTIDGVLDLILDLLTTLTRNS